VRTPTKAQVLAELMYAEFETPVVVTTGPGSSILGYSDQPAERIDALRREAILMNNPIDLPQSSTPYLDPEKGLIRAPANEALHSLPRTVITITHRGFAVGYVFAVDPDQRIPSDWHLDNAGTLEAVGLEIELMKARSDQLQLTVRSVLSAEPAIHHVGVESLRAMRSFEDTVKVRVVVSDLLDSSASLAHFVWEGSQGGAGAAWAELDHRLVMVLDGDKHAPMKEVGRLIATLHRRSPSISARHGIGGEVIGLDAVRESYHEALGALRVAKTVGERSPIASWDHLGSWRTLLALGRERGLGTVDPRVARLVESEGKDNVAVLREYLERNGEVDRIAAELHLHRSTIYSRLRRVESKFDLDLNDTEDRLSTLVGLRLAQLYA
jgi:hypothetical protein